MSFLDTTIAKLPALGADPNTVTITGYSSGAMLAEILYLSYSDLFKGAGFIAGSPYYCVGLQNPLQVMQKITDCTSDATASKVDEDYLL